MAAARRAARRTAGATPSGDNRYTIDASVFVNAFNPHEEGHVESLALLASIQESGDPIIVPTLFLPETVSAVA
ncbi:MAG: hypothetical protein HY678_08985, partial [Chloroflexi bacterium]|nr:hypothetical protein [Chloroflexota bacterium]